MKRFASILAGILGMVAIASYANAQTTNEITPFIGVDYYQALMRGKGDWNLVFPKNYPGASAYVGTKFHENFGVELGYDWSTRAINNWVLLANSSFFGSVIPANQGLTGTTKIRRTGGHFDVLGFLPVVECLELLGSVGVGWVQTKLITAFNVVAGTTAHSSALASIAGQGRAVFRVGIGALYMVTDIVGVRGKVSWEGTSTLRVKGNALFTSLGYNSKAFKGTTALSVGAFVKF